MKRPELLCPAGSPESLRAAVESGADAVYLGWGSFNARQSAKNFSDEEFAHALLYCHERGVNVYLTLNTLVTDRELSQAIDTAAKASALGVDAVLVQDLGLLDLLRRTQPDLPLHASTQMSIFTSGGACQAAADGCERVVIARECSREDTAAICQNCPAEIEVFVHGALCMCYSGQCEFSALIGGRSGNRGRCAQPCRLPYGINAPAKNTYPLSLKDNCLAGNLEDMARMGVACLKLEGRMKRPEYVAVVTGIYATLLREGRGPTVQEAQALDDAFSRSGFTDGYWEGRIGPKMFGVRPPDAKEPKELFSAAMAAVEKGGLRSVPVRFSCEIRAGVPSLLSVQDVDGHTVTVTGPVPEAARNRALTEEELSERLSKTGGTAYRCETIAVHADGGLSLSAAAINALRRDALAALTAERTAVPNRRSLPAPPLPEADGSVSEPLLTCSVARADQLTKELLAQRPARVYLPLELFDTLTSLPSGNTEWCAILPRIWRDRDEPELLRLLDTARSLGVTGALLSNPGHFPLLRDQNIALYGDFGLNMFNSRTLAYLQEKGLSSATVSFELKSPQIRALHKPIPTEAIVYGRLPLMITENCLIKNSSGCSRCQEANELVDRTGARFPILPAWGHRSEIQNSRVLYLGDQPDYRRLGLSFARLRFTSETPEDCVRVFQDYRSGAPAPEEFTRGLFVRGVE